MKKETPQARYSKRRASRPDTRRLDVLFDLSKPNEAKAWASFETVNAKHGGPKPALLALLDGVKE
jgi:hypothetical protein